MRVLLTSNSYTITFKYSTLKLTVHQDKDKKNIKDNINKGVDVNIIPTQRRTSLW